MHIIIAEQNLDGRKMLGRILKAGGYEVSIANPDSRALDLLKESRSNIVLMNVSECQCSSTGEPERSLIIRQFEANNHAWFVTCGINDEKLGEFIAPEYLRFNPVLEVPSAKITSSSMNRVLQLCSALSHSKHRSLPDDDFNWRHFSMLMTLPTDAYLGCRFFRSGAS